MMKVFLVFGAVICLAYGAVFRRCSEGFDGSCSTGDLPNASNDEDELVNNGLGKKRCANLYDESCASGGIIDASDDEDWLINNSPGKRCANLYDEGCANGGIIDAGDDEDWLIHNGPGKKRKRGALKLEDFFKPTATKRCANLFDETCAIGGVVGAGNDENWLVNNSPGKRQIQQEQGLFNLLSRVFHKLDKAAAE